MSKNIYVGDNNGKSKLMKNGYVGINGAARPISKIYVGVNNKAKLAWENIKNYLCFTAEENNSTIVLTKTAGVSWNGSYSRNKKNWLEYIPGTTIELANIGDNVYFKGSMGVEETTFFSNRMKFTMTGKIAASGNIMSLCSGEEFETVKTLPYDFMFYKLFYNCSSLTTAPELPATILTKGCYDSMFYGCTSLTTVPQLPATVLADQCYSSMFFMCKSLTTAPELPATTLARACYNLMFYDCTLLAIAPELPATTLADLCYGNMFNGCKSLTTIPQLPATILKEDCYSWMFQYCTKIKLSTTKTGEYTITYRIPMSGTGTTATNALTDMFANTAGTFKGTPTINTTYYLSNTNSVI